MEIGDNLRCVFSAEIDAQRGSYVIEIPTQEITSGNIQRGEVYRAALLATTPDAEAADPITSTGAAINEESDANRDPAMSDPPVETGDIREVEIEDIGEQGDGIARVERGFVIIVPETESGDRVTIEITNVRENVAFAEVVERPNHV